MMPRASPWSTLKEMSCSAQNSFSPRGPLSRENSHLAIEGIRSRRESYLSPRANFFQTPLNSTALLLMLQILSANEDSARWKILHDTNEPRQDQIAEYASQRRSGTLWRMIVSRKPSRIGPTGLSRRIGPHL